MKVRVGSKYYYHPVLWDQLDPPYGALVEGQQVRVVNLHGCPKANTMDHCHIETLEGVFLGLVHCNSLTKEKVMPGHTVERITRFPSGRIFEHCACGALRERDSKDSITGRAWHECSRCTHPNFHREK